MTVVDDNSLIHKEGFWLTIIGLCFCAFVFLSCLLQMDHFSFPKTFQCNFNKGTLEQYPRIFILGQVGTEKIAVKYEYFPMEAVEKQGNLK